MFYNHIPTLSQNTPFRWQPRQKAYKATSPILYWLAALTLVFINAPLAYSDTTQQSAPCIECHQQAHLQPLTSIVDDAHARAKVSCLDCHNITSDNQSTEHHNYRIITFPGSASCQACHQK
ncbi:MAG: hypothetical protein L3J62_07705 [Gammaproteobacteria bacterium]|nr:hypothetical protein [Gammaproteobacteria bacterium]MCF6230660.1 hypothetical protein [Gammaproteobacteria bacterium]